MYVYVTGLSHALLFFVSFYIQPILPTAVPPPTFNLPPPHAPMAPGQVIAVQPRPQPKATFPSPRHLDNLPALAPPTSQTLTHRQLETLWRVRASVSQVGLEGHNKFNYEWLHFQKQFLSLNFYY